MRASGNRCRAKARRAVSLLLAALLLPLTSCEVGEDFNQELMSFLGPLVFLARYASAVWFDDNGAADLDSMYAEGAVRPDLDELRGSIDLAVGEDLALDPAAVHDLVIEANMQREPFLGSALARAAQQEGEAGSELHIKLRVSRSVFLHELGADEGDSPRDGDGASEDDAASSGDEAVEELPERKLSLDVRYKHNAQLEAGVFVITFELWGTDPESGDPKAQRHRIVIISTQGADDDLPEYAVSSHTVEELEQEAGE